MYVDYSMPNQSLYPSISEILLKMDILLLPNLFKKHRPPKFTIFLYFCEDGLYLGIFISETIYRILELFFIFIRKDRPFSINFVRVGKLF